MTRDSQGKTIWPGQMVAYNYSGEVHPGEVIEARPPVRVNQWHTKDDLRIKNLSNGEDQSRPQRQGRPRASGERMTGIKVKRVDTISAQTPVPASLEETRTFLGLLQNAAAQGYQIKGATAIETGQRDPYTVGMRIVMEREAPQ